MTKKEYNRIVLTLRELEFEQDIDYDGNDSARTWTYVVREFANAFVALDPKFDKEGFMRDCGYNV